MPIAKLKDVSLYYEEFGYGNRVLIQAQQFVNSYLYYAKDLADKYGFHVYQVRIRGYAPSSTVDGDLGEKWYDVWAQDVCDFADYIGVKKFFYTGHSHGAGIGWHLCLNHPDRVIAFFASAAGPHKKDGVETGKARMDTIIAAQSKETWIPYAQKMGNYCSKAFDAMLNNPEEAEAARKAKQQTIDFWVNMPQATAIINPRKPFTKIKTEEELANVMAKIKTPTLLLGSCDDDISPPELMIRSLRNLPDAKLVIFKDADHVDLPLKYHKEYAMEIVSFCKEKELI